MSRIQRGLTLLEILIVISIISILGTGAVLGFQSAMSGWTLNTAARQVVMDLKLTRLRAIAEQMDRRLLFADGATVYRWQRRDGEGYVDDGPSSALPTGVHIVRCSGAGSGIGFRARGHAAAFGTITLTNATGAQRRIVVDIAGRARVE